jgi:hypothetical protein
MQDSELSDLTLKDELSDDDLILITDVQDTTATPQGTSKRTKVRSVAARSRPILEPGDVLNFPGIDPYGLTNSSQAINDAIESPYAVHVTWGLYRSDDPIIFETAKIFWCFGGVGARTSVLTNSGRVPTNIVEEEQARFFTLNDINMFEIRCEEVHIRGGLYELSHTAPTKAVFFLPAVANGSSSGGTPGNVAGWGGTIKGAVCVGHESHVNVTHGGGTAVHYDFINQTVANAYWTHQEIDVECRNLKYGIYASARNPGYGQFANNCKWKVRAQAVKSAIWSEGFNSNIIDLFHQGDSMFLTQAETLEYAGLYLRGSDHIIERARFFDFGKGQHNNGWWHNEKKYDVQGKDIQIYDKDEFALRDTIKGETFWPYINNAVGFIPHTTVSERRGVFQTATMDEFTPHAMAGTVTWGAYSGTNVIVSDPETDFTALTTTSATASIPTSSDITLANTANYLLLTQARPTATWNAQAVTDKDYVEIVIAGAASKSFDHLWQVLGCTDDVRPLYIHILRFTGASVSENLWLETPSFGETRNLTQTHYFACENGNSNITTVIRLIGCNLASLPVAIQPLYGVREVFYDSRFPVLYRNNVGPLYDSLLMKAGGIGDRVTTTTDLTNITHEINTSSYKQKGLCVWNDTTNKPVWATDDQDGSPWADATGTNVHTPV